MICHPLASPRITAAWLIFAVGVLAFDVTAEDSGVPTSGTADVTAIFDRIRGHEFHPLGGDGAMTIDRHLQVHGIADLSDRDWQLRLQSIADLVRQLPHTAGSVVAGLSDRDLHVRQIAAAALGICRTTEAIQELQDLLSNDVSPVVRSQAAMSLGQMESHGSLDLLRQTQQNDGSRDVRHQCELAIDQIEKEQGATAAHREAFASLDPASFGSVQPLDRAPNFELLDTADQSWSLSEVQEGKWVLLIWIFADWCPVCHGEFRDLIESQSKFEAAGVEVVTIECHDRYRCRVMVGKELAPDYWFAKQPPKERYESGIWWPHLVDHAGAVGAVYGADPMSFAVHAEYINRPTTVIIDPTGTIRLAYRGTYWGDRPTIDETLDMIRDQRFEFEHKNRRKR